MNIAEIIARYGLPALFLGAGLEGETVVIAGGLLAHRGLVSLPGAMAATAAGSLVADQILFLIGRRLSDWRVTQRLKRNPLFAKALSMLERYPIGFIFAFRFIYGLRTVSPVAIGTSGVAGRTYLAVNAAAAVVWGITFTMVGFVFGNAFEGMFGRFRPHGLQWLYIAGGLVAAAAVVGLAVRWRQRRAA